MTEPDVRLRAALADRYVLERELGAGGMATVYLAHDVRHDRKVALKVLRPELAAILGGARFLKEIRTTANLQHPHILPLHDSGEAEGIVYYVMPYVEGESLRERLVREKQLPVEDAVRIAREVASALDYAHRHQVVHRDIKPENILLHDGQALVADFGIALAVSTAGGGTRMTETGMSLGTPHYMSPEQAMGEREVTAKSDVYALGCVLYEMLVGEPPFTGPTAQAIIARVVTEEPRSLTIQRKTIPLHVEAAVHTALAKLPADRFQSAAQFAEALAGQGGAPPATLAAAAARPVAPRGAGAPLRWLPWGVAAAGLAAAAAGWLRKPEQNLPLPARFYYQPDSLHQVVSVCCGPAVAISPDGRSIAYEGAGSEGQFVFIRDRDQLQGRLLAGTLRARNLFFSPDGQWVGFASSGSLRKVPVTGGSPVTVTELPVRAHGAAWTGDNTIVVGLPDSSGLFRVSADGGQLQRLTRADTTSGETAHVLPHYVPDADVILYAALGRDASAAGARVAALHLRTGRSRIVSLGSHPHVAGSHLVTLRDGGILMAQPFDPSSGDTTGPAVRIADAVVSRLLGLGEFAVSGEGTLVQAARSGGSAVLTMVQASGAERRLPTTFSSDQVAHFDNPRLSPDGRRLVVAGYHDRESRHIGYLVDVERGASLRLTFDADTEFLEWAPDGETVVFVRDRTAIAARRADRSGEERIVHRLAAGRVAGRITVSRDHVAFARTGVQGSVDLWSVALSGGDSAVPYLATPFNELAPALSPDGRWLAWVSDETGRPEVYVSGFPTVGARIGVSVEGGSEPQWGRDRRTLYFRALNGDLMVARLLTGAGALAVESRRTLFRSSNERSADGAEYDVAAGGDRFLMVGLQGVGGGLIVVLNAVR
ncbi:MAG: serine/threonine-protein kinase [Gemmatimonadetes bacterium]|nr:serine/threonine-protein kinase [Gemmatimonadota bacterium]